MATSIHAVTGAFGYSGRHIAELLLAQGKQVRSLTGHPDRPDPFGGRIRSAVGSRCGGSSSTTRHRCGTRCRA
jgi:NADH dehydrogenase